MFAVNFLTCQTKNIDHKKHGGITITKRFSKFPRYKVHSKRMWGGGRPAGVTITMLKLLFRLCSEKKLIKAIWWTECCRMFTLKCCTRDTFCAWTRTTWPLSSSSSSSSPPPWSSSTTPSPRRTLSCRYPSSSSIQQISIFKSVTKES